MNSKRALATVAICLLFACGKDDSASSKMTLDTSPKEHIGTTFQVQRWNSSTSAWESSSSTVEVDTEWRFISYLELSDGSVAVKGGYTTEWTNTTSELIECRLSKTIFYDSSAIPLAEHDVIPDDTFNVSANSSNTRNGSFEIYFDDLSVTDQVTRMGLFGAAVFK